MTRKIIFGALLLTCAIGLGLNVATVVTREAALARDSDWRFRIAGFDPLDPFRGRYIEFTVPDLLAVEEDMLSWIPEGETFYAFLERDPEGYARIASVTTVKPGTDGDWLTLRHRGEGSIEPTFTRYYVNERRADALDRRFADSGGRAYISVRISGGIGVITGIGFDE